MQKTSSSMAKKKATKVTAAPASYTATAIITGIKYTGSAETILDALKAIKPGWVRGKCILLVSNGERTVEKIVPPLLASRLFNTQGVTREVSLKNAANLFLGL